MAINMELAAVIVDNRKINKKIIEDHLKYLPDYTNLYIIKPNINSMEDYNKLLCSKDFWKQFQEENILIFQQDSGILRKGIEDFYDYDFVGAPLHVNCEIPFMNGGLSLRKKSSMIRCLEEFKYEYKNDYSNNEDVFYCKSLHKLNAKMPSFGVSKNFSVETIFSLGSFGYHSIKRYLTEKECDLILNQYLN